MSFPGEPEPERLLPHDKEAEAVILGAILIEPARHLAPSKMRLAPADFYSELHPRIFRSYCDLASEGTPIDLMTVTQHLAAHGGLTGPDKARVAALIDGVHKAANISHHIETVAELAARRRMILAHDAVVHAALNGTGDAELRELVRQAHESASSGRRPRAVDLATVIPTRPRYSVDGFFREGGLHLEWGEPSAGKTWTFARAMVEMMLPAAVRPRFLFGHPGLAINRTYRRVLWIGTEENAATFRSKLDEVLAGLGLAELPGEFLHIWASDPRARVDMTHLPDIVESEGPDAVVLDSLTGLRPRTLNGQPVKWDADNDAANVLCIMLRGLALSRNLDVHLLHHTGRERGRYRGPIEWQAAADVVIGLEPADGNIRVKVEKNRDGRRPEPFMLTPSWARGFTLTYEGAAPVELSLPPKIQAADAFLRLRGTATQAEIMSGAKVSRQTARRAAEKCIEDGLWRDTGKTINCSPVYEHTAGGA